MVPLDMINLEESQRSFRLIFSLMGLNKGQMKNMEMVSGVSNGEEVIGK